MSSQSELSRELQGRPLTHTLIMKFKARSLRGGQWFKALERRERGLIDATLGWVNVVRSKALKRILTGILSKLVSAMRSIATGASERGRSLAFRLSDLAVGWGNGSAWSWRFDGNFRVYLGIALVNYHGMKLHHRSSVSKP